MLHTSILHAIILLIGMSIGACLTVLLMSNFLNLIRDCDVLRVWPQKYTSEPIHWHIQKRILWFWWINCIESAYTEHNHTMMKWTINFITEQKANNFIKKHYNNKKNGKKNDKFWRY